MDEKQVFSTNKETENLPYLIRKKDEIAVISAIVSLLVSLVVFSVTIKNA